MLATAICLNGVKKIFIYIFKRYSVKCRSLTVCINAA